MIASFHKLSVLNEEKEGGGRAVRGGGGDDDELNLYDCLT